MRGHQGQGSCWGNHRAACTPGTHMPTPEQMLQALFPGPVLLGSGKALEPCFSDMLLGRSDKAWGSQGPSGWEGQAGWVQLEGTPVVPVFSGQQPMGLLLRCCHGSLTQPYLLPAQWSGAPPCHDRQWGLGAGPDDPSATHSLTS